MVRENKATDRISPTAGKAKQNSLFCYVSYVYLLLGGELKCAVSNALQHSTDACIRREAKGRGRSAGKFGIGFAKSFELLRRQLVVLCMM